MDIDEKYFSNITSRERAIFEGAISMGALFHEFSLTGDMLDVKIYTKVKDVQATIRIEFIEELNYPLMYVEDIN